MGELLLCNQPLAKKPYQIEGLSWNIYSMEELCYYIESNPYLLDESFISEELCQWIALEMGEASLAEGLRKIRERNGHISESISLILNETGYCPLQNSRQIVSLLQEMEEKSDFECGKIRADRLMYMEKYLGSIYEYKRLLDSEEASFQEPWLVGNIWHNLGTAYARLFVFKEAGVCYEKAYKLSKNEISLKSCLLSYIAMGEEMDFLRVVEKYEASGIFVQSVKNELSNVRGSRRMQQMQESIEALFDISRTNVKAKQRNELSNAILSWKEEYRKICRI
uniref:hypothetical protein n=1 Tax=Agathobacter sp. TaxID=2021311 RepID=UPI0040577389